MVDVRRRVAPRREGVTGAASRHWASIPWRRLISDVTMALAAVVFAVWFRFNVHFELLPEPLGTLDAARYWATAPVVAASLVLVFALLGVYRRRRGFQFIDELFAVVGAMVVTGGVLSALNGIVTFHQPDGKTLTYSRLALVYWLLTTTLLITLARYAIRRYDAALRVRGVGVDSALVVGRGEAAELLIQRMRMFPDYGYRLVGIVADGLLRGSELAGTRVLGEMAELSRIVANRAIDYVFVALPEASGDSILELMETCRDLPVEFRIVPSMLEIMTSEVTADQLDGIPLLQVRHGLDTDAPKSFLKRSFDVAIAALSLLVGLPLMLLIAALVRVTSPGPVFFRQERVGLGGRTFPMYKFRTMREDAEAASGPVWAVADDPRTTAIGRLLRRSSLDELPQFWNILRGEMSFVGPRPERPVFVEEFTSKLRRYADRHRVRPGLTGWAQVNDLRGQTPVDDRLIYDLYYIENWSLKFDLKIVMITLFRIFTHRNAY